MDVDDAIRLLEEERDRLVELRVLAHQDVSKGATPLEKAAYLAIADDAEAVLHKIMTKIVFLKVRRPPVQPVASQLSMFVQVAEMAATEYTADVKLVSAMRRHLDATAGLLKALVPVGVRKY
ncbi:hypothetical protein [Glycocaulis sp.]|uniref:hypothetical protein n=1 Tax=Glycocaulis sp. TaxID=1969725 RepID=UPI003F6F2C29